MAEHRPTDEQLRDWADPDGTGFPAYWESEHHQYLDAMFTELLQLRQAIADHDDLCARCGTELLAQHRAATTPQVTEVPEDRCSLTFPHTRRWCGNDRCAPSVLEGQVNSR